MQAQDLPPRLSLAPGRLGTLRDVGWSGRGRSGATGVEQATVLRQKARLADLASQVSKRCHRSVSHSHDRHQA